MRKYNRWAIEKYTSYFMNNFRFRDSIFLGDAGYRIPNVLMHLRKVLAIDFQGILF